MRIILTTVYIIFCLLLIVLGVWFSPLTDKSYEQALEKGDDYLAALEYPRAEAYFNLARNLRPWQKKPRERLALSVKMKQDIFAGQDFLEERDDQKVLPFLVLSKQDGGTVALLNNGQTILNSYMPELAIKPLEKAAAKSPNRKDVWYILAKAYNKNSQKDKAVAAIDKALAIDPVDKNILKLAITIKSDPTLENRLKLLEKIENAGN